MKVAIVGCGHIANIHVPYIISHYGAQIVGLCDLDESRVRHMGEKYKLPYYTEFIEMLDAVCPDVVHILTPPQTHAELAIQALEKGCHVLIEKPMCLTLEEADQIIITANMVGKKVCVDHTYLFSPLFHRAKKVLDSAELGDVVHIEGLVSDDYLDRLNEGKVESEAQQLRGGKLADLIPHPLYIFLDLIPRLELVSAFGRGVDIHSLDTLVAQFTSPTASATLTMLLRQKPLQHCYRVYCTKGILEIDLHHFSVVQNRYSNLPNAVGRVTYNVTVGTHMVTNTISNAVGYLLGRFDPNAGIRSLIEAFYQAIFSTDPSPVPAAAGRKVVKFSASIWDYLKQQERLYPPPGFKGKRRQHTKSESVVGTEIAEATKILVTGATGFIGSHLVSRLVEDGHHVRVLCRKFSRFSELPDERVEVTFGDMRDESSLQRAVKGIETIYHLAVTTGGEWDNYVKGTIEGTHNLLMAASTAGVHKFIYVSSLGVLRLAALKGGTVVDEAVPLENKPEVRGAYSRAKVETEKVVRDFASQNKLSVTIIRPGVIYGPGKDIQFLSDAGIAFGNKLILVFGSGNRILRLTHIENLIDGLILAAKRNSSFIQIYHFVDEDLPSLKEYVNTCRQTKGWKTPVFYVPVPILLAGFELLEVLLCAIRGGPRPELGYRLRGITRNLRYDITYAKQALGWRPKRSFINDMTKA